MVHPHEIERSFRNLLWYLSCPSTGLQKLRAIVRFCESIDEVLERNVSYLVELCQIVPGVVSSTRFEGSDPHECAELAETLRRLHSSVSSLAELPTFPESVNMVQLGAATMWALVGDWLSAFHVLGIASSLGRPDWLVRIHEDLTLQPYERAEQLHAQARKRNVIVARHVRRILALWCVVPNPRDISVAVPVVERPPEDLGVFHRKGYLRRITIKVAGTSRRHDDLQCDVGVFDHDGGVKVLETSIAAARHLVAARHPTLRRKYLLGQVAFEMEGSLHQGASANLALAAIIYCAILRLAYLRGQFDLSPFAAVSGNIDTHGNILPVDGPSLPLKIEAAFFSPVECVVVPREQVIEAEAAAHLLSQRYPRKDLAIVGASHLRELFFDRRITRTVQIPLARLAFRWIWRRRMALALVVILLLGVSLWRVWYGPMDKNPVHYTFEGEFLVLSNAGGQTIKSIRVGTTTALAATNTPQKRWTRKFVNLVDVDDDGVNDVLWAQFVGDGILTRINCTAVTEDTSRWSFVTRKTLSLPRATGVEGEEFETKQIIAGDLDGDGRVELYANTAHRPFFPSVVFKIDARTGKEISHYLHIGALDDMVALDLDGDGRKELVLCGVNNALRTACVVVLDPRCIRGHSPWTPEYATASYREGTERAYVTIPRSCVGTIFADRVRSNFATGLSINRVPLSFNVTIYDLYLDGIHPEDVMSARLFPTFGPDLSVLGCGTDDRFDLLYERFVREGRIKNIDKSMYLREYAHTMLYWDGTGWRHTSAHNKHYCDVLRIAGEPVPPSLHPLSDESDHR